MSPNLADASTIRLLTVEEVADLFQVRARKVYDLIRDGLPHLKVGRFFRFRLVDVQRWQESRTTALPASGGAPAGPVLVKRDWSRRG